MSGAALRGDLVAGITVALILVPQSMAYAQLAGMPPVYGLHTAFLPVAIAALFGSSHQLATGPVLAATGTLEKIGAVNVFNDENVALTALAARVTDADFDASAFPLLADAR
jgi:MFS superfamily sulfate permease-like transporter